MNTNSFLLLSADYEQEILKRLCSSSLLHNRFYIVSVGQISLYIVLFYVEVQGFYFFAVGSYHYLEVAWFYYVL